MTFVDALLAVLSALISPVAVSMYVFISIGLVVWLLVRMNVWRVQYVGDWRAGRARDRWYVVAVSLAIVYVVGVAVPLYVLICAHADQHGVWQ